MKTKFYFVLTALLAFSINLCAQPSGDPPSGDPPSGDGGGPGGSESSGASTTDASALSSFASSYKKATKDLGAFDEIADLGSAENTLMGISGTAGHFDKYLAELVSTYASDYYSSFTSALSSSR